MGQLQIVGGEQAYARLACQCFDTGMATQKPFTVIGDSENFINQPRAGDGDPRAVDAPTVILSAGKIGETFAYGVLNPDTGKQPRGFQ